MTNATYTNEQLCQALANYSYEAAKNLRGFIAECENAGGFASFVADGAVSLDIERIGEINGQPQYMLYHRTDGNLDPAVTFAYTGTNVFVFTYESEVTGQYTDLKENPGPHNLEPMVELTEFLYNWTEGLASYNYSYTPWKAVRR